MPEFDVEVYELHSAKYAVAAANRAEAVKLVLDGGGVLLEGSLEFIEPLDYRTLGDLDQECPGILAELQVGAPHLDADTDTCIRDVREL